MLCIQSLDIHHVDVLTAEEQRSELSTLLASSGPKEVTEVGVAVVHGGSEVVAQPARSADVEGHYSWTACELEIFDGESGETLEFFIEQKCPGSRRGRSSIRRRIAIATTRMERFRRYPEERITARLELTAIDAIETSSGIGSGSGGVEEDRDEETKPYIEVVACWTDDVFIPTFLQSLFCTACITMADIDFGAALLPKEFLPARCRAQKRLLERGDV